MPHHETRTVTGTVADIFAHRFVLDTAEGRLLADLGPKGAERVGLRLGETLTLEGEQKPSELKVRRVTREGTEPIDLDDAPHEAGTADAAREAARALGFAVVAEPRRKPKHWEVPVRAPDGSLSELHLELDGSVRKAKPFDEEKWGAVLVA